MPSMNSYSSSRTWKPVLQQLRVVEEVCYAAPFQHAGRRVPHLLHQPGELAGSNVLAILADAGLGSAGAGGQRDRAVHDANDVGSGQHLCRGAQPMAADGTAAALDKAAFTQLHEDGFEKLARDNGSFGDDVGACPGTTSLHFAKYEGGTQSILGPARQHCDP
jgi:hypothetical protein